LRKFLLTFDTEDFISENSVWALGRILEMLKKHEMDALFFLTGHMAERLRNFDMIIDSLKEHQIGYHSSSHSVHPTIFEFTDVPQYDEAYRASLERETSHVNPLSGEIEGKGGIRALRELFPEKQIKSFRAPGLCWTPPHSEALRTLGLSFDFSAGISAAPVKFKGITFYPRPSIGDWQGTLSEYRILLMALVRRKHVVITSHPSLIANKDEWDSIFRISNPQKLVPPTSRSHEEVRRRLRNLDLFLNDIAKLQKMQIVEITPKLETCDRTISMNKSDVEECYKKSMHWAFKQNYKPKFLLSHFFRFFKIDMNLQTNTDFKDTLPQSNGP
jgi:peptidoglycan/xylan/chitin deacetylase (PgdA/CDA1 family)